MILMIFSIVTALAFTGAAAANAFNFGGTANNFQDWGYTQKWRFITAAMEVAGAVLILAPRTRSAGLVLLGVIMIGALITLLRKHAGWGHLAPAIGFISLLIADSILVYSR